jgi:uncharacterized protein YbjT (DUF2867 family)
VILVTGATGTFGGRVARLLADTGLPVRALVRDRQRAAALGAAGVELFVGDLDRREDVQRAVEGASKIFLCSAMHPRLGPRERGVIEAAQRTATHRIVKVSGSATLDGHPLIPGHTEAIEALKASGVDWTVVSPSFAMETALGVQARLLAATGAMCGCTAGEPLALVAAGDVARASAAVLDNEGPVGGDFELTGPEALPLEDVARSVAHATGRRVHYRELTEPELRQALLDAGFPEPQVDFQLIVQFRAIRAGGAAKVTDGVEQLTGSRPIGLGQFLATEGSGLFASAA